jgi:1-acyl-sn-glycerol-3-phosphate acyltransferase
MKSFSHNYRPYIKTALKGSDSDFSLKTIAKIEPILGFLYEDWWKVELGGLKNLPDEGPALIVANAGGVVPWAALMLMYGLMNDRAHSRRLNILAELDWIEDERLYSFLREIGFVSFSSSNAKRIFNNGETAIIFPEGVNGAVKTFGERYRLRAFDWTKLMPAIEMNVPLIPLATIGPDESFPVGSNWESLAKVLSLPAFPVTPFFPWLPFPFNFGSLPVRWKMRMLKVVEHERAESREKVEEVSKNMALYLEGEVQAELNRVLRTRVKSL